MLRKPSLSPENGLCVPFVYQLFGAKQQLKYKSNDKFYVYLRVILSPRSYLEIDC